MNLIPLRGNRYDSKRYTDKALRWQVTLPLPHTHTHIHILNEYCCCVLATQSDCLAWFYSVYALHISLPISEPFPQTQHCSLYFDKPRSVSLSLYFCSFSNPNELLDPTNATLFTMSRLMTSQLAAASI